MVRALAKYLPELRCHRSQRRHPRPGRCHADRAELCETIGLNDFEMLDASIVQTIVPQVMPNDETISVWECDGRWHGDAGGLR
ncbi:hypothetical protein [Enterovirga rhinocerotis]|uniref:hypothetical protein n=1 Tax=Enterovirga rhinocerotis TaxID=1339210 RepID=UPI00105DE01B|nr:hypothetical protein [Enterovirga rhinocerotis]